MIVSFTVPLPPAALSPNARGFWATKYRAGKDYKELCWGLARQASSRRLRAPVRARITFVVPDNIQRDQDNLIASLKHGLDGIRDAILEGDSAAQLKLVTDVIVVPRKREVRLELEELP